MINLKKSFDVAFAMTGTNREDYQRVMGVSFATACKYARGACISVKSLNKAAELFDMPVSEFIKLGESE